MTYRSRYQQLIEYAPNVPDKLKMDGYETIEWPIGALGGDRYPHYVVFYINEAIKSEDSTTKAFTEEESRKLREGKTAGSSISTVFKSPIESTISATEKQLASLGSNIKWMNETLGTAMPGEGLGEGTLNDWSPTKKRLKTVICLPMPQKIRANYGANYSQTDEIGAMGATILSAISGGSDLVSTALLGFAPTAVSGLIKTAAAGIRGIPGIGAGASQLIQDAAPTDRMVSQMVSKISGRVINKRQEQLFSNMKFRTHEFSYLFIPRNEEESDIINTIIREFKIHMHPDLSDGEGSSLLITPAEFDIDFRFGDFENDTISKIATCALENFEVNYTAIGEFVAFKGTPNPVAISIDLSFVEMEPLNKTMIKNGY